MNCPSDETRMLALLGELSVNEARALAQHREGCAACRAADRDDAQLLSDLASSPPLADSEQAFTERVMSARDARSSTPLRTPPVGTRERALRGKRNGKVVSWAAALGAAACAAAVLLVSSPSLEPPAFQARGVSVLGSRAGGRAATDDASAVSAHLLFVRDAVFYPLSGARLHRGDALAVRYSNVGDQPRYLAVFALDAERQLHWVYPAYMDPAANPGSVPLLPGVRGKMLEEVVEPEAPALGELQVFALVTAAPIHVQDVEAVREQLTAERIRTLFSGADVQTWRATWNRE